MAKFASSVGLFYVVAIFLTLLYFLIKYIRGLNHEFEVKVGLRGKMPVSIQCFLGWYQGYKEFPQKFKYEGLIVLFFQTIGHILIRIAGETMTLVTRFYFWLCIKVFHFLPAEIWTEEERRKYGLDR